MAIRTRSRSDYPICTRVYMYSCLAERTITGRQRVAYGHIILLALYLKFTKKAASRIAKNYRRRQPHSHFLMPPPRGTPMNMPYNLYLQKLDSLSTFVSLIVWV